MRNLLHGPRAVLSLQQGLMVLLIFIADVVFGSSLSDLCERERAIVPRFIQECVLAVENRGTTFCRTLITAAQYFSVFFLYVFQLRVPTSPGKSWIFFLENSRTWKVLENHFGPGKSWKNIFESRAFVWWFKWKTSSNSIAPSLC